jgi:TonB family protein
MVLAIFAAGWLLLPMEPPGAAALAAEVPGAPFSGPVPLEEVRHQILKAGAATVVAACGSSAAPWGYRGARGDSVALKPYASAERERPWARAFAEALLEPADWDSTQCFRGRGKPCSQANAVPLFVIRWHVVSGDVYAMISFESRCAQLFEVQRPLGTVWFRDRADTVFAMVREAFAAHPVIGAMSVPPEATLPAEDDPSIGAYVPYRGIEKAPNATHRVLPEYPQKAREQNKEGTVRLRVLIGEDGVVHDAFVAESIPGLDDAALDCVWDWKFEPASKNGKPLAVWVNLPVKFTLTTPVRARPGPHGK